MAGTIINSGVTPAIGISDLTLIRVVKDTRTEFTTDDENMIDMRDKVVSRAYTPESSEGKFYSSNSARVVQKSNKGGNVNLVISDLSPAEREAILSNRKTAGGVTVATGDDAPPEYVVAYRIKKAKSVWELHKYAKVVFATPSETAQTENESFNAQTSELIGTISPLTYEVAFADGTKSGSAFFFAVDSNSDKYEAAQADWFTKGTAGIIPESAPGA